MCDIKNHNYNSIEVELRSIKNNCPEDITLKLILECNQLSQNELRECCTICKNVGFHGK